MKDCQGIVAHNLTFDVRVLGHALNYSLSKEYIDQKFFDEFKELLYSMESICTSELTCMLMSTDTGNNYGRTDEQFKRISLKKLNLRFFGKEHEDQHTAIADTTALRNCFNIIIQDYWDVLCLYETPEKIISNVDWLAIEHHRKNVDLYKAGLLPNWLSRTQFASVMLNYQRGTLISIKRQSYLFGTLFGKPIL